MGNELYAKIMSLKQYRDMQREMNELRANLEVALLSLQAIHDYAFNPAADTVNAGDMNASERLEGAGCQALAALEVIKVVVGGVDGNK